MTIYFKDDKGNEIARINIGWTGKKLHAKFGGAKERAERLAAILNALGADVEAREYGGAWYVQLTTDSITAIRRKEWLDAVRVFVEELYRSRKIDDEKRDRLLREIDAGPNVVEVAGVEMSVSSREEAKKTGKSRRLEIVYRPTSAEAFDAAVKALKAAGFEEGVHFTAKRPEGGERGYVYLRSAGLWKLVELERQGVDWAERALKRLEEIARARGFSDLLDEHLRPAREAGLADPRGMVAEDKERGIRAEVKDLRLEWEGGRPRIVLTYEVGNRAESFFFTWRVAKGGEVRASVWLDYERAAVLAALTGDESLKERSGVATLTARHLLALVKYVGWDLLWWYARVMGE